MREMTNGSLVRAADDGPGVRIAVAVDDTDDLTKVTSTGAVAEALAHLAVSHGGTIELGVTRHQLPRLAEIAYTSHNSSMAFIASVPSEEAFRALCDDAAEIVASHSVPGSDPGLCIYRLPDAAADSEALHRLRDYGMRAKHVYVTKGDAYAVAATIPNLRLTEHGGGGEGVIGALAGVALRLFGSDGRFRGTRRLAETATTRATVAELVAGMGGSTVAQVCDTRGAVLGADQQLSVPPEGKAVLLDSKMTLLARQDDAGNWRVLGKKEIRDATPAAASAGCACDAFETDNDCEELEGDRDARECANCLYRRWTNEGLVCLTGSLHLGERIQL